MRQLKMLFALPALVLTACSDPPKVDRLQGVVVEHRVKHAALLVSSCAIRVEVDGKVLAGIASGTAMHRTVANRCAGLKKGDTVTVVRTSPVGKPATYEWQGGITLAANL